MSDDPLDLEGSPHEGQARTFIEPGRKRVSIQLDLLDDMLERIRKLAGENRWDEAEALRIVVSRGLVQLEQDEAKGGPEHEGKRLLDIEDPRERERFLLARLQQLESTYAVMKFTAFNALRDNQTLRMNVTGLRAENQALTITNKYLRGREDELRARIADLERAVAELAARTHGRIAQRRSRWDRIKELVRAVLG